jgi:RNA polymerase sigma-70 factor (ECF subfamily)
LGTIITNKAQVFDRLIVGPETGRRVERVMVETEIIDLTTGLAAGDEQSFRQFHTLYFDPLLRYLVVVTGGDEQAALDALQETLLRVVRHARPFTEKEVFWSWLTVLARSAAKDGGRKKSSYLKLLTRYATAWVNRKGDSEPVRDTDSEIVAQLGPALESIGETDRLLVEGKYYEGQSTKQLASSTGMTEKAVESRLLRARRKIKSKLLTLLSDDSTV